MCCHTAQAKADGVEVIALTLMTWAGSERWPPGCSLRCLAGDNMGHTGWYLVEALAPGECCDINLEMTSPATTGVHQGQWRMSTPTGHYFGGRVAALFDCL